MPPTLRERLEQEADASGRSLNAEIVQRLERSLSSEDRVIARLNSATSHLEQAIQLLVKEAETYRQEKEELLAQIEELKQQVGRSKPD